MSLMWIKSFSDKELFAPYVIENDNDYYKDLRKRLTHFIDLLKNASADEESIKLAEKYSGKVCEAVRDYYKGNIGTCHQKIENLVKECINHPLAVSVLEDSKAFPGTGEIQFFRARNETESRIYEPIEMLHRPFCQRAKYGNFRFSIPGIACLYLANSSYGCWVEMGRPSEHDFNVSAVVLDGKQKIFNLAVMTRMVNSLDDGAPDFVHCWIKLLVLMIATSYRINEKARNLRSEYIVSQSIMLACKKHNIDGVAYFSKRVDDEIFSLAAINLALFAEIKKGREYGIICERLKIDESMNYQLFRQLDPIYKSKNYQLRIESDTHINNIGRYRYQYGFKHTEFIKFDKFLFSRWSDKNGLLWGNALDK